MFFLKPNFLGATTRIPISTTNHELEIPGEASRELAVDLGVSWVGPSPITDWAIFDGEVPHFFGKRSAK